LLSFRASSKRAPPSGGVVAASPATEKVAVVGDNVSSVGFGGTRRGLIFTTFRFGVASSPDDIMCNSRDGWSAELIHVTGFVESYYIIIIIIYYYYYLSRV
jgi:hypothetical protein